MTWAYCDECGAPMPEPTAAEVLEQHGEEYRCPHCNAKNDPRKTPNDLIAELLERVAELEARALLIQRKD